MVKDTNSAPEWRTSTFTYGGSNCVEVASCPCDADPGFRKSAASMGNGNCTEVGASAGLVLVRDTKDRDGAVLAFGTAEWRAFTAGLKAGVQ